MKRFDILLAALIAILGISGCSKPTVTGGKIKAASVEKLLRIRTGAPDLQPVEKKLSILDLEKVTLFAKAMPYKKAIMRILKPASIDVAFSSELSSYIKNPAVDLSLNNVSLREALNTITGIVGISWKKRKNTIWITPFKTKIYDIGFLGIVRSSQSSLGGDVLGGGSSSNNDTTVPLQGSFSISSKSNAKKGDRYQILENNIKNLLSKVGHYTLDQAGGILMVTDKPQNIRRITDYINAVSTSYKRQVMIEAKIIEVQLNKDSKVGINWASLGHNISLTQKTVNFGSDIPVMTVNISKNGGRFTSVIEALSKYGSLSLLSEPHLRVINAQPAILSVGRSVSFIKKIELSTSTTSGGTATTTPTVDISSIFDGIVFGITPFIKSDNTVLLRIVPIKSKLVSLKERDISGNVYTLPIVDLREESTVVSVRSGSIVVLGGLISRVNSRDNTGVPILSHIPIAGLAFEQKEKLSNSVELVILLKPVIID